MTETLWLFDHSNSHSHSQFFTEEARFRARFSQNIPSLTVVSPALRWTSPEVPYLEILGERNPADPRDILGERNPVDPRVILGGSSSSASAGSRCSSEMRCAFRAPRQSGLRSVSQEWSFSFKLPLKLRNDIYILKVVTKVYRFMD